MSGAAGFKTIAGRWREHLETSGIDKTLQHKELALAMLMFYAGFSAALADVFDNAVPPAWRADLFALIDCTPHLDWLLLTKRIGNVERMVPWGADTASHPWPSNIWLGATVVNQAEADRDIPKLLAVPAAVRFLSIEPMLGPIRVDDIPDPDGGICLKPLAGLRWVSRQGGGCVPKAYGSIDWIICGGESGPGARPMHPGWARSLRDQCAAAGVPLLFKQHGEWIGVPDLRRLDGGQGPGFGRFDHCPYDAEHEAVKVGKKLAGRLLDGVLHDGYPS